MSLFRKKTVQERAGKKWTTKTCLLSQLEALMRKEGSTIHAALPSKKGKSHPAQVVFHCLTDVGYGVFR